MRHRLRRDYRHPAAGVGAPGSQGAVVASRRRVVDAVAVDDVVAAVAEKNQLPQIQIPSNPTNPQEEEEICAHVA